VSVNNLEQALRDLPSHGKLLKSRPYRQIWRFEFNDKPYYLKFYPRTGGALKRLFRGSPAWREFSSLQLLQKKKIPSPHAISHLSGYTLNGAKGDAVLIDAIEPSQQLDLYFNEHLLRAEPVPNRYHLGQQLINLIEQLGKSGLGHSDLHLGNFLLKDDQLYLLDGYAVRPDGLKTDDVLFLAHSVSRFATRTELHRGWQTLGEGAPPPRKNSARQRNWRKFLESAVSDNDYFGRIRIGDFSGHFFKHHKLPRRWSRASQLEFTEQDWQREWPNLLARIESDQLDIIKRSKSGDVLAAQIVLSGRPLDVIIKRPRRSKWYRYFTEIGRGARARRAWLKGWSLVARDIPTAWPLLLMEKRILGYAIDQLIIFERVPGTLLTDLDLNSLDASARQDLFRRLGRTLRNLEAAGLSQYDSKSTNWIILPDEKLGPVPVMIDVDGIRRIVPNLWPIDRLLRSMREHPQYARADSKQLCLGYAPHAPLLEEQPVEETSPENGISNLKSEI